MSSEKKSPLRSTPLDHTVSMDLPVRSPEFFNFGYDVLDRWAKADRNKLAMIWVNQQGEERRYTFNELRMLSNQAANFLIKHGISRGDRVMLMLPRLPEWWIFSLALIKLGAVQCPSPTLLTPKDLKFRVQFAKFKGIVTDSENAPKFDEIREDCPMLSLRILVDGGRPGWLDYHREAVSSPRHEVMTPFKANTRSDELMLLLFTSGTSKNPKLVCHNYDYPLGHRITAELWHGLQADDLHYTVSDTGWGKNIWGNYFGQWIVGCCVFIYHISGKFHADELLPLIEKYGITSFCAPPTVYRMLILNDLKKFDFKDLRSCTAAGEALHSDTVRLWRQGTGLTIREGYGQTETVCMISTPSTIEPKSGSMGIASPGWEIELQDDDGKVVPPGEDGRIAVRIKPNRPVGLCTAYYENQEENERSFVGDFYYTGDKAILDEDGYFWFVGRSDDIIKSSGYRIGPSEVEDVMMMHPAVHEVAVVGAPDPLRGAKVKAYVVLNEGYDATDSMVKKLQQYVKSLTAPYKYPREVEFVRSMPKTFSGKIKRDVLRRHAQSGGLRWDAQ